MYHDARPSGLIPTAVVTGGKCCLRIGSAQLIAPESDCEKSTSGTAMGQKMRPPGLAVFSLSNERAGPKDRKYDPSRSHYKKVSLLR
eukprot:COSAG01_NODE_53223_length_340_cov_7.717842_1_plen_86_part_10